MRKLLNHVYEAIGETPLVRLDRIVRHYGVRGAIFAKLEYLNPGFSKKDRPALQMIEEAEACGALKPGQTVVELTSGNTGTGLAIVCRAKGYPFVACMSEGNSPERARMMRALGAEVFIIRQSHGEAAGEVSGEDLSCVEEAAQELVRERKAFRADQFRLAGSVNAHLLHTAEEIWEQSDGKVDAFVDTLGSGGTFAGTAGGLKKRNPAIRCYAVEPEAAARYAGLPLQKHGAHKLQGCGYNLDLPKMDLSLVEAFLQVSDAEAVECARDLARHEGAFVGFSSGANVMAAVKLLRGPEQGKNIALTLNDSGLKYLSTDLFE